MSNLARRNILITGGAGFLGRGIMRLAQEKDWRSQFTVYSRDEYKQDLCKSLYPGANYILGDVRDIDRLEMAMINQDIVIHAAALKYVPEAESNVAECIDINVAGSRAVLAAAWRSRRVRKVIGISTDKAVEPVNTYGLTKALMERCFLEAADRFPGKEFTLTRYGNVVGSTGSVVPLFKRQYEDTGTIKITDPGMTRFWIGVEEAVQLIDYAAGTNSGNIVVPQAKSMSLADLAMAVCPNAGIEVTGVRPGEKRHEKLLTASESRKAVAADGVYYYNRHASQETYGEDICSNKSPRMTAEEFCALAFHAETI